MNRTLSNLGPALVLAVSMVLATALAGAAPHTPWTAAAGPLLLVLGLVSADLLQRYGPSQRSRPSSSALLLVAAILVACAIVAARDLDRLAGLIPILGSCAAVPVILRQESARPSCRRA